MKVGSKIICIDNSGRTDLIQGKIYTVRHFEPDSVWVEGAYGLCRPSRFKPARKDRNKPGEYADVTHRLKGDV